MRDDDTLRATITELTRPLKGILAADESQPTITKRIQALGIESTEETRRGARTGRRGPASRRAIRTRVAA